MVKTANNTLIVFIIIFFLSFTNLFAEDIQSPINQKYLKISSPKNNYAFLIAGHLYGAPEKFTVFPSSSFLGKIKDINEIDYEFFISLGDNFRSTDEKQIANFKKTVAYQLKAPLFIAVGNHDVTFPQLYEKNFGKTYYHFIYGQELYVILNSEMDSGRISGAQLEFLLNILNEARNNQSIKNVFVFSHKLIWSVNNSAYRIVYDHLNDRGGYAKNDNYLNKILPPLSTIAKSKAVYWISGDIGCSWSLSLFYEKDPSTNITYIATGLGDTVRDAIIKVNISEGAVYFTPISLAGEELHPMEYYGTDYWRDHFGNFSYNFYKKKFYPLLFHKYYWIGILTGIIVILPFTIYRCRKSAK